MFVWRVKGGRLRQSGLHIRGSRVQYVLRMVEIWHFFVYCGEPITNYLEIHDIIAYKKLLCRVQIFVV